MSLNYLNGGFKNSESSNQMIVINNGAPRVNTAISYVKNRNDWYVTRGFNPNYKQMREEGKLLPMMYYNKLSIAGSYSSAYSTFSSSPSTPPNPPNTSRAWWTKEGPVMTGGLDNYNIAMDHQDLVTQAFPDISPYVQVAASNLYNRGWDALTFLGELESCIKMFRGIGKSLIALLLKGNLADTWLQWRYGWRTLYMDMMSLQEAILRIDDGRKRFQERDGARNSFTRSQIVQNWNWSTSSGTIIRIDQVNVSVQGMVVADIVPPRIHFNPVKTGWELITLSFIVDWFINVGQWIDAMSFLAIQTGYTASASSKCTITSNYILENVMAKSPSTITNIALSGTTHSVEVMRVPTNIPLGLTTIRRLNFLKVLDLTLIVRKLFSKGRQAVSYRS